MTKILFGTMAVIEAATGAALLIAPAFVASLLLGAALDTTIAQVLGRVAGAALLALGIACWFARAGKRAALGVGLAMLLDNGAVAAVLAYAGARLGLAGMLLWPAVILHAALAACCAASAVGMKASEAPNA
jgi:hypothetical protein